MLDFNVKSNIDKFSRGISAMAWKQLPFATAQALNAIAAESIVAEKQNEERVLDRPKPFTMNAIGYVRAKKDNLAARVYMKDATARYLEPYEFGGTNRLAGKALLKPVGAVGDLDQYGNLPRSWLRKIKGRSDIFIGPVKTKSEGVINGVWQRAAGEDEKATRTTVTKGGKIITRKVAGYVPSREGRRLRLLVRFQNAHQVKQHLDWFGVARRTVEKTFNREMGKALAAAIATAR
jgi:hypothetical protein